MSTMNNPSYREDHMSQIPALQLLMNMGYTYMSQEEALAARGGKTSQVLLETVLRQQLKSINSARVSSTRFSYFSDSNIETGIRILRDIPMANGLIEASKKAYELIALGKALEQNIDGDKKSFTLRYIDWENPEYNVYHVTEEYSVMRAGSREHYRPDIVLFVNGIPLIVIECKRPDLEKSPIQEAISQHLRNQQPDGIGQLYLYTQILLALSVESGSYGTVGAKAKFWGHWEEKFRSKSEEAAHQEELRKLKNTRLSEVQKIKLFEDRFRYVRSYFDQLEQMEVQPTAQDSYLYGLCCPDRMLDFTRNLILYEDGIKKIARYQQYFAIKRSMEQVKHLEDGKRKGGVIWHTQGSGKSLTMVLLAQAIASDKSILNPKIVLVTDRTDLDRQIRDTFKKCEIPVEKAKTGKELAELLHSKSDVVITTVINKFETAVRKISPPISNPNVFVLVDEGHRTQHGTFNVDMERTLPNACYLAFTGTPLFKKEKNTIRKFGKIIDSYTVEKAVQDGAVLPLLYEGRHVFQKADSIALDEYFGYISEPLNDYEKADLKKKFSKADQLNIADQKIYAIAWDISRHFQEVAKGTGFKAQLVCQSKDAAVRYKEQLDSIGIVSSELLISGIDTREGEDSAFGATSNRVKNFWKQMMAEHGTAGRYEENIIGRFKNQDDPEIIIVVDKLLTGFDAPRNKILYLTRKLQEHTLLQAIARVNRVEEGKDYGYIIDYYGVLGELDEALDVYSSFQEFDSTDLAGTLTNINEEVKKLPGYLDALKALFKTLDNKRDAEAYRRLLRDEALRVQFYSKFSAFARMLAVSLSSRYFMTTTPQKTVDYYKDELKFFTSLRKEVMTTYSDKIDYKQYEAQIQKLINTHVQNEELRSVTEQVDIFDRDAFKEELARVKGDVAKADTIVSRTTKYINERIDEDPAFYRKFSEMIRETIRAFEEKRLSETEFLRKQKEIMDKVLSHSDSDLPAALKDNPRAGAYFGLGKSLLSDFMDEKADTNEIYAQLALSCDQIIRENEVVDWPYKIDVVKRMIFLIGEFIIDEIRDKYDLSLSFDEIDTLSEKIVDVAKANYK